MIQIKCCKFFVHEWEKSIGCCEFTTLKNYSAELKLLSDKNLLEDHSSKILNLEVCVFSGLISFIKKVKKLKSRK